MWSTPDPVEHIREDANGAVATLGDDDDDLRLLPCRSITTHTTTAVERPRNKIDKARFFVGIFAFFVRLMMITDDDF